MWWWRVCAGVFVRVCAGVYACVRVLVGWEKGRDGWTHVRRRGARGRGGSAVGPEARCVRASVRARLQRTEPGEVGSGGACQRFEEQQNKGVVPCAGCVCLRGGRMFWSKKEKKTSDSFMQERERERAYKRKRRRARFVRGKRRMGRKGGAKGCALCVSVCCCCGSPLRQEGRRLRGGGWSKYLSCVCGHVVMCGRVTKEGEGAACCLPRRRRCRAGGRAAAAAAWKGLSLCTALPWGFQRREGK